LHIKNNQIKQEEIKQLNIQLQVLNDELEEFKRNSEEAQEDIEKKKMLLEIKGEGDKLVTQQD